MAVVAWLAMLMTLVGETGALAQALQTAEAGLPAAATGLPSIPLPRLESLERPVATQLRAAQQAFLALTDRVGSDAELTEAYGAMGQLYHAYELVDQAEASYLSASHLAPGDHRWHHLLGRLYEQQGRLEEAADRFSAAHTARPEYPASLIRLGFVQLQLGQLDAARASFTAALALAPDPAAHAGLGETALADRRYADAIRSLQTALDQVPAATRLHYSLAMAYRALGDLDQARVHLAERGQAGVAPRDPIVDELRDLLQGERVQLIQGQLAFAAGQYGPAAAAFEAAVAAAPESVRAHVDLGAAFAQLGEIDRAIAELRTALDLNPENVTAHFNLGVLLAGRGDAGAIGHFEAVLDRRPDDVSARRALADALLATGREADAEAQLTRIVEERGDDESALMHLVGLQTRQGRYRDALERLDAAHTRRRGTERTRNALARLLAASPDATIRDGRRALEISTALYEARPVVAYGETVAQALAEIGRCAEAADWQRRLVAAAERAGQRELLATLAPALARYERGAPCRPPTE